MPKTNAEKCREYRQKKKKKENKLKKVAKSSTERVREFRARQNALLNNICNAHNNASTVENSDNDHYDSQVDVLNMQGVASIGHNIVNNDSASRPGDPAMDPAVKREPDSPAESGDEAGGGETFFSSPDPVIKTEIAFLDSQVEFEQKTSAEGGFELAGRKINIKVENDAYFPEDMTSPRLPGVKSEPGGDGEIGWGNRSAEHRGGSARLAAPHPPSPHPAAPNPAAPRPAAVKPEPGSPAGSGDEGAGGGPPRTDTDVAHSDVKVESAAFSSSFINQHPVLQDSVPSTICRKEPVLKSTRPSKQISKSSHPSAREKQFSCTQCSYRSHHKGHLKGHMLIHSGEKPFACPTCAYTCIRKGSLSIHLLTHTGEKPFSCSECSYTCNIRSSLRRHALTHSGEKPFSCSECNYTCNVISSLRRHTLIHTGKKPFSCTECDYKCTTKGNLRIHMVKHTRHR